MKRSYFKGLSLRRMQNFRHQNNTVQSKNGKKQDNICWILRNWWHPLIIIII